MNNHIPLLKDVQRRPENVLVNVTPNETRVAILEDETLCEIHIERYSGHGLVGNIYLGVVRRVLPGMQSAFIDIGLERAAFLHIVDIMEQRQKPDQPQRIEHTLFEGQSILVQVIKDPINTKGARLSTQISLAGRFLVYLPQDNHIGISQRIDNEEERNQLRERLDKLLPANTNHGYIIRTSAENATDEELRADIAYLTRRWEEIQHSARTKAAGTLLYQDLPLSLRVLRDMYSDNINQVWVDSEASYKHMQQFANHYAQDAADKLVLFQGTQSLFETYHVEKQINEALQPRVNLSFGGYLIIEATEAMTTIDVNTGGFVGARNFDETIFKTNLEACQVIAREIRLRNLGGIIIIDFIDMMNEEHRQAVLQELVRTLSFDRTRVTLNGFTSLGLVELTRKRTRENLNQVLCEPCPHCHGLGLLKTPQTICYEIMREIIRENKKTPNISFRILAAPVVIDRFLTEEANSLERLSQAINQSIALVVESSYNQDQYDVVGIHLE